MAFISYLRRLNSLGTEILEPASSGLDTDSSPSYMPTGHAPFLTDFLVDRAGKLPMRGPIQNHAELAVGTNELVTGMWTFNNKVLVGTAAKSASAVREPQAAPFRKAANASDLAAANTTMKYADVDALTVADVAGAAGGTPYGRGARLGAYVYGFAYDASTAAVSENGGYLYRRRLLQWDGTTTAPTVYTNAPEGGQDVKAHLNRLFVLGGRDVPGGAPSTIEQNTLYWSANGGPTADTTANWKDPVSGLVNKIVVDSNDPVDFGVALAKIGQNLAIFKRHSIHVLYGYSPSTFTIKTISQDRGCIDPRSIVEYEDGCYFASQDGCYWFNGTQLINVTNSLRSSMTVATAYAVGDNGADGGRVVATKLPNDYILFTVCRQNFGTGAQDATNRFAALYHTQTRGWSRFSSNVLANPTPTHVARAATESLVFDGNKIVKGTVLTTPELVADANRGYDSVTVGGVQSKASIPSSWQSRILSLSSPTHMSFAHRLLMDYLFQIDNSTDDANQGWWVQIIDGRGQEVLPAQQMPAGGDPSAYLFRRRFTTDFYNEAADIQIRVWWQDPGTAPAVIKAEIYDTVVEYQSGRQRRST